ncbi:amino acid ABC transporter permease [Pelagibacterium montanilacus]|uniref:amino acid ABC transporter permease n=1 Tax=Pelagibacterium montanilacus TaxID=2185280 RepID=UPI000F8F1CC9|nr:amino acid ABC transporter permease [Pelagibacterium montanilacus]
MSVAPSASGGAPAEGAAPRRPAPPRRRNQWRTAIRPTIISVLSVLFVFGALGWWVTSAEMWPQVRLQFFNLDAMIAAFPGVLRGFGVSVSIWLSALVGIGVWALVLAIVRSLRAPWFTPFRLMVVIYIDIFRGIPVLLLVLLFGFGIPALNLPGLPNSGLFWGAVAMILSYSAYVAEIYRSGIDAVHEGQWAASKSLGLSEWQTMVYAVLPQALRNVLPALMNIVVALQKDVALLSVIGVRDAVREAQIYTAQTFNYSSLIVAAALFMAATIPMARLADYVTRKDRERRLQRAG